MANSPSPLYWDTDVFIHRFQRTPQHIHILEQITEAAERNEIVFVQSTYTIAELVKDPDGGVLSPEEDRKIQDFFENDYVITRTLTEPIAFLSRKISRDFGVKPKDAVHLATAIFWKVPVIHTYEKGLIGKSGKIGDPPLIIAEPSFVGQPRLPLLMTNDTEAESTIGRVSLLSESAATTRLLLHDGSGVIADKTEKE